MQTLSEIRALLASAGLAPRKGLGQNFLIDANLMAKLLELADLKSDQTVLEVGPGTGSLTEELLLRAGRVVAVELDRALADLLRRRLAGQANLTVLHGDVLSGKHALAEQVLAELRPTGQVVLVANLPYNVAIPLILNCLLSSWEAVGRAGPPAQARGPTKSAGKPARPTALLSSWEAVGRAGPPAQARGPTKSAGKPARPTALSASAGKPARPTAGVRFERLTFTVQKELVERLTAEAGEFYGPASVLAALLARATPGRIVPPRAFWPPPKVQSQMLRLDFDQARAAGLKDARALQAVLSACFGQRRKTLSSGGRLKHLPLPADAFLEALVGCGINPSLRPEQVSPQQYLALANALCAPERA